MQIDLTVLESSQLYIESGYLKSLYHAREQKSLSLCLSLSLSLFLRNNVVTLIVAGFQHGKSEQVSFVTRYHISGGNSCIFVGSDDVAMHVYSDVADGRDYERMRLRYDHFHICILHSTYFSGNLAFSAFNRGIPFSPTAYEI